MRREDITVPARGPVNRRFYVWTDAALTIPASLTGWTAAAQVRTNWRSDRVLHTFACVVETAAVRITATAAQTALWPSAWPSLTAVWDLVLTEPDGTLHDPLVGGQITVDPYVTRP